MVWETSCPILSEVVDEHEERLDKRRTWRYARESYVRWKFIFLPLWGISLEWVD